MSKQKRMPTSQFLLEWRVIQQEKRSPPRLIDTLFREFCHMFGKSHDDMEWRNLVDLDCNATIDRVPMPLLVVKVCHEERFKR